MYSSGVSHCGGSSSCTCACAYSTEKTATATTRLNPRLEYENLAIFKLTFQV
ncbi:hypothetical protein Mapa_006378 [Marchantia paleacea]|nr:hypothetical protein Mapa_006378 [Marchantia paleacea]